MSYIGPLPISSIVLPDNFSFPYGYLIEQWVPMPWSDEFGQWKEVVLVPDTGKSHINYLRSSLMIPGRPWDASSLGIDFCQTLCLKFPRLDLSLIHI